MNMLVRIVVSLVLAPMFLVVLLFAPVGIVTLMVTGIVTIAAYELLRAVGAQKHPFATAATLAAAALIPSCCFWAQMDSWAIRLILLGLLCVLFLAAVFSYGKEHAFRAEHVLFGLFGGVLYPMLMSSLVQLRMMEKGQFLVMLPIVSAFLTDTGSAASGAVT